MIESKLALLDEQEEVLLWDTVVFSEHTLGLVPEIFDAVDVVLSVGKQLGVIDTAMVKIGHIKCAVTTECVSVNDTIRLNFLANNGH